LTLPQPKTSLTRFTSGTRIKFFDDLINLDATDASYGCPRFRPVSRRNEDRQ
jgi:hypothetical protein